MLNMIGSTPTQISEITFDSDIRAVTTKPKVRLVGRMRPSQRFCAACEYFRRGRFRDELEEILQETKLILHLCRQFTI